MNDIDILEEFIEAYRIAEEVLDGDVIQAISNLIAENKELKEENIHWKGKYHLENRKYLELYDKKIAIPKINATEEMLEQYVEKIKIIKDIEELEDYIQHSANPLSIDNSKFAIKILQSLLGKE